MLLLVHLNDSIFSVHVKTFNLVHDWSKDENIHVRNCCSPHLRTKTKKFMSFRFTVTVVVFSVTITHNILITGGVFSGNLKEELV